MLVGRDSFLVLDLLLYILNGITGLDFQGNCLSGEGFNEDLHVGRDSIGVVGCSCCFGWKVVLIMKLNEGRLVDKCFRFCIKRSFTEEMNNEKVQNGLELVG